MRKIDLLEQPHEDSKCCTINLSTRLESSSTSLFRRLFSVIKGSGSL